jgi:hypothetical protein
VEDETRDGRCTGLDSVEPPPFVRWLPLQRAPLVTVVQPAELERQQAEVRWRTKKW